jgi:hypothetical protein
MACNGTALLFTFNTMYLIQLSICRTYRFQFVCALVSVNQRTGQESERFSALRSEQTKHAYSNVQHIYK